MVDSERFVISLVSGGHKEGLSGLHRNLSVACDRSLVQCWFNIEVHVGEMT